MVNSLLRELPGVDVSKGIAMTGGTVDGYKKVLSMFRKDALERLALLQNPPDEAGLPLFVTQVHALKSASGSIGAAELSEKAARLETAGKGALAGNAGDLAFIREALSGFTEQLAALAAAAAAEEINKVTAGTPPRKQDSLTDHTDKEGKITSQESVSSVVNSLLGELATALKSQKAETIDRILEELTRQPLDPETRKTLEQISDEVLMTEFDKALRLVASCKLQVVSN